jgi:hypothetical protein
MRSLASRALRFTAGALVLYALLFAASEVLVRLNGHANALYKISQAGTEPYDVLILGASHAMPLDFDGMNVHVEALAQGRVLNLAAQGTGPIYQGFALDEFLSRRRARRVIYAVDGFAFRARDWNEDRLSDPGLLAHTPLSADTARHLASYVVHQGVDFHAWLDYVTGFSKVNDAKRFQRDAWEGEAQFERSWRPSSSAVAKRISYLYPKGMDDAALQHAMLAMDRVADSVRAHGLELTIIRMPLPDAFRTRLPPDRAFDEALSRWLAARRIAYRDFSGTIPEARFYFDSDHLNREGVSRFLEMLGPVLRNDTQPAPAAH